MDEFERLKNFSILNIDKPSGPTSFQVSNYLRKRLELSKTSHMGTLDPKVTGVLPITLGRACRLSKWLMGKDKRYVGIMRIHEDISESDLKEKMNLFVGKINQLPPKRSSVKRQERERDVKLFRIIEKSGKDVLFETEVQAGTYIRKLIHDLGEMIGGAHMLELRRTKAGLFSEEDNLFINLYNFEKALEENNLKDFLIPAEEIIKKTMPYFQVNPLNLKKILTGKPVSKEDVENWPCSVDSMEYFALFNKESFVSINKIVNEKDFIARPEFVFN